jgi:hypothetical protein
MTPLRRFIVANDSIMQSLRGGIFKARLTLENRFLNQDSQRPAFGWFGRAHGECPVSVRQPFRLLPLLAVAILATTAHADNPLSVEKHKNGVSIRFQPGRIIEKKTPAAKPTKAPVVAPMNNLVRSAPPVATKQTWGHAAASTPAGPAVATLTNTVPVAAVGAIPPGPGATGGATNSLAAALQGNTKGNNLATNNTALLRYQAEADQVQLRAMQQAAREAQFQQNRYQADTAGDLGAMGADPF